MKSGPGFLRLFDGAIDRILCVIGAVLFSQGPEFMQQYLQRLGGHLDESRRQLAQFHGAAAHAGVPFETFVQQTSANSDAGLSRLGGIMHETMVRTDDLQAAHDALLQASLWSRPFVFLRHVDIEIARATAGIYRPAVPTTLEGLIYASVGMLFFLTLYHLGSRGTMRLLRRSRSRVPAVAGAN